MPDLDDAVQIVVTHTGSSAYGCARRAGGEVRCWRPDGLERLKLPDVEGITDARYLVADEGGTALCVSQPAGLRCLFPNGFPWTRGAEQREGPLSFDAAGEVRPIALLDRPPRFCFVSAEGRARCPPLRDASRRYDQVAAGSSAACGVSNGRVYCGGSDRAGALGDGPPRHGDTPVDQVRVAGLDGVVQLEAAPFGNGFCARTRDDAVWCWGDNLEAGLGVAEIDAVTPRRMATAATDIALRSDAGCLTTVEGEVRCFGDGGMSRALQVPGLQGVVELVAGEQGTCARITDGQVFCWGDLASGAHPDEVRLLRPTAIDEARGLKGLSLKTDHRWMLCGADAAGAPSCVVHDPQSGSRKVLKWDLEGVQETVVSWHASSLVVARTSDGSVHMLNADWPDPATPLATMSEGTRFDLCMKGLVVQDAEGALSLHPFDGTQPTPIESRTATPSRTLQRTGQCEPLVIDAAGRPSRPVGPRWGTVDGKEVALVGPSESVAAVQNVRGHVCVLGTDAVVSCSALVPGDPLRYTPEPWTPVPGSEGTVQLVSGKRHICMLHDDRTVSCAGHRGAGRLGRGVFYEPGR